MAKGDQDLLLKLRFRRLLFMMGYYSPTEVELSDYAVERSSMKRRALTDLDVLGIRFDEMFVRHVVVCDCKSGRQVSDPNRLFWLRGVSDYFGADAAYLIRRILASHARSIAPKLSVSALSEGELLTLEKSFRAHDLQLPIADPQLYARREDLWGLVVSKGAGLTPKQVLLKPVYEYLSYRYWYIDEHRRLLATIDKVTKVAPELESSDPRDVSLAFVGLERFILSVLQLVSHVSSSGLSEVEKFARMYIFGGALDLAERERFVSLLNDLTGANETLLPECWPQLIELVQRVLQNPSAASRVLPCLESIYLWCEMVGNIDLSSSGTPYGDTATVVMLRDFCIAWCKATGVAEEMYRPVLSL